jgi:hypothetical protein
MPATAHLALFLGQAQKLILRSSFSVGQENTKFHPNCDFLGKKKKKERERENNIKNSRLKVYTSSSM